MSNQTSFNQGLDDGFTVKSIAGCRVVYGKIPVSQFAMLNHGFSKKAIVDISIANRIGATLVIGEPDDIEVLRGMDLPVSEARHLDYLAAAELGIRNSVAMWLRNGERGESSDALCKHIFGVPESAGKSHPYDPDDLRRCVLFLDAADAHDRVHAMRDVSPEWAVLVDAWDELVASLRNEMANKKGNARKTYQLMKSLLERNF